MARSRSTVCRSALLLSIALMSFTTQANASITFTGDATVPFTCPVGTTVPFGYVYKMQAGGSQLPSDLSMCGAGLTQQVSVVGVINSLSWNQVASSPINIAMYVSQANQQRLMTYLSSTSTTLWLSFSTSVFDPLRRVYFQQFANGDYSPSPPVETTFTQKPAVSGTPCSAGCPAAPALYPVSLSAAPPRLSVQLSYRTNSAPATTRYPWGAGKLASALPPCVQPRLAKGMTKAAAKRKLTGSNCGIAVRHVHAGNALRGKVVRVSGKSGKTFAAGHKVTVYIGA